ncbi:MAG TPA: VOC family protein [Kofleriaceae bacterium]|nr:VOC family protein [Kofleriaceae bacterium]
MAKKATAKPKKTVKKPPAKKPPAKKPPAKKTAKKPAQKPAKKSGWTTVMFRKVAFTAFSVEDPSRARAFYEGVLGFERGLASPDGAWTEYDLPGGGCLALFRHPDPAYARPAGGATVAFEVADLDALNQRLAAAGVSYQGDLIRGPRCRMSNITDSEGNSILLHQLDA